MLRHVWELIYSKRINRGRTSAPWMLIGVYWMGAHWRHLANTIEPPVCGSAAASCQIT